MYLSAGMSIIRTISHIFTTAMAIPKAMLPIYINGKPILYSIEVLSIIKLIFFSIVQVKYVDKAIAGEGVKNKNSPLHDFLLQFQI